MVDWLIWYGIVCAVATFVVVVTGVKLAAMDAREEEERDENFLD